jgi:HD superfamily phosphodiesterase
MTLESWATAQAERLIGALGDRWTHVQAVADKARGLAAVLSAEDADLLVAAALVHDVGYAPSLNRLGFHAVDGAWFLHAQGHERLARLVAHHSGARFEPRSAAWSRSWPPSRSRMARSWMHSPSPT